MSGCLTLFLCARRQGVDLYILEDLSSSFGDDITKLAMLSQKLVYMLDQFFQTKRIGIGSFVDVGGYCFRNDHSIQEMTGEELQTALGELRISDQNSHTCPDATDHNGEASMSALWHVGAENVGFSSDVRAVLMSTDDYFKLGADGGDHTSEGFHTGCEEGEASGFCHRIHSVDEVSQSLGRANAPDAIVPVFAIAPGANIDQLRGLPGVTDATLNLLEQGNLDRLNSYKDVMTSMGYNASKFVLELDSDSSNFVDVVAIALRQIVGDLPDECLPGDQCATKNCGGGTCHDTPYGPAMCENCAAGKAAHPTTGECTLDIDECCSSPCEHGGACTDGDDSYTCDCDVPSAFGWTGENCELDIDECAGSSGAIELHVGEAGVSSTLNGPEPPAGHEAADCVPPGTRECVESIVSDKLAPGEWECHCVAGWTGVHCEVDINECSTGPCENNGAPLLFLSCPLTVRHKLRLNASVALRRRMRRERHAWQRRCGERLQLHLPRGLHRRHLPRRHR